jgi:NAD(P) transhydrogenase subunit beta
MPVLEVWKSGRVVALKRSMATGYSGVDNPLYFQENTRMLFGDAKESLTKVAAALN